VKHVARQTHPETEISYRRDISTGYWQRVATVDTTRQTEDSVTRFLRSYDIKILLKSLVIVLLTLGGLSGGAVFAEAETYIGLQYGMTTYEENGIELEPISGILRIGQHGEGSFSYEVRLGTGLAQGEEQLFGTSSTEAEVEIDSIFGAYLLAQVELTGSASVYGIFGITSMEATATASVGEFSDSVSYKEIAPSFGLGLNYEVLDNILLNTEFVSYVNGDDFSASVFSLGILFY
jgi:hypothetical protein